VLIAVYLAAIAAANLMVTAFGPAAAIPVAFSLIGLDLTCRDALHERWRGRMLWPRMFALVATGGMFSYVLERGSGRIALASCLAFTLAGITDAAAYRLLESLHPVRRVNGSNIVSAAVDSFVFPTVAFGAFSPMVVIGQFIAKVGGGLVWGLALYPLLRRRHEAMGSPPKPERGCVDV
jgi:uncharacterized PurR-regulated membrane protein YhhQ (DUF165 family)